MTDENLRQRVKLIVKDMPMMLFYYDRKEDEEMPLGAIEDAISRGVLSHDDILRWFKEAL